MLLIFLISLGALGFALLLIKNVLDRDTGSQDMRDISDAIKEGAEAFLRRQNTTIALLAVAPRLDQIALDHYPCARTVVYLRVSSFRFQVKDKNL